MIMMYSLYLLVFSVICIEINAEVHKISQADKTYLLKAHNDIRRKVALGEMTMKRSNGRTMTEPSAAQMFKLTWDDKLAGFASQIANRCEGIKHSSNEERSKKFGYRWIGENIYGYSFNELQDGWQRALMEQAMQEGGDGLSWVNEVKDADYSACDCNQCFKNGAPQCTIDNKNAVIGHYVALVTGHTRTVGCGIATCPDKWQYLYCQYGQFEFKDLIYEKGAPCSKCKECDAAGGLCLGAGVTNSPKDSSVINQNPKPTKEQDYKDKYQVYQHEYEGQEEEEQGYGDNEVDVQKYGDDAEDKEELCVDTQRSCANYASELCKWENGYTGTRSRTISGRKCQAWNSNSPHEHSYNSVADHNYCRNYDSLGPWCYTTDPDVRWEYCFNPCSLPLSCDQLPKENLAKTIHSAMYYNQDLYEERHFCLTYEKSNSACTDLPNGHEAIIHKSDKEKVFGHMFKWAVPEGGTWNIGLHQAYPTESAQEPDGNWKWVLPIDGAIDAHDVAWADGEPNNEDGKEDCAIFSYPHGYVDVKCWETRSDIPVLCQYDPDCQYTEWSAWVACTRFCDNPLNQFRTRAPMQKQRKCNGQRRQERPSKWGGAPNCVGDYSSCAESGSLVCLSPIGYSGKKNTTRNGVACQRWDSQRPHTHTRLDMLLDLADDGQHNYCRNPDAELGPWCYTVDENKRWDYCFDDC